LSPLAVVFAIVFLDLLGVGILTPVFPFLIRQFRTDAMTVGLMALAFSAAQFLGSPVLGALGDRHGRRPVLIVSLFGTALGYFLFGWAGALWLMFVSRVIDGITGGNISTAQAYIADISKPEDRAKNFGLIGAAFGLGFIVGPALGGLLAKFGLAAPAFAAGALSLVTMAATWLFLPESLPPERRTKGPFHWREIDPLRQIVRALARPELVWTLLAIFAANFAMAGLQSNFAVFAFDRFAVGPGQIGLIFASIGATGAVTQGLLIRRLATRIAPVSLAIAGLAVAALGFFGISLARGTWWLYPSCMAIALGMGLSGPSLSGLLSSNVAAAEQGSVLGVSMSLASLARVIGPVAAGGLYDQVRPESPYVAGALSMLAGVWLISARPTAPATSTPSSRVVPSDP
jgi:multidrug resistance protein